MKKIFKLFFGMFLFLSLIILIINCSKKESSSLNIGKTNSIKLKKTDFNPVQSNYAKGISHNQNKVDRSYPEGFVCCSKTPVYTSPSMKGSKKIGLIKRGDKVKILNKIMIQNKHSYDFAEINLNNKHYYIPIQYVSGFPQPQKWEKNSSGEIIGIEIGTEIVDKYNSLPHWYSPKDLASIPNKYKAGGYKSRSMQLRLEAWQAFKTMIDAAAKEGIELKFISCFRTFQYQEGPYKRTIRSVGPKQKSSAKPGHSEHQLGTAADVSSADVGYRLTQSFAKTKSHRWIVKNAHKFGIYISYTKDSYKSKGYIWEPWHLRYWANHKPF